MLQQTLKDEGIKGNHLMYLDKNDLHRLGINNFGDKIDLLRCMQKLWQ